LAVKASRCVVRLLKGQSDVREVPDLYKEKNRGKNKLFRSKASARSYFDRGSQNYNTENEEDDTTMYNSGSSLNVITDNHMLLSDYAVNLANTGNHNANALMVRLHDLGFCLSELQKEKELLNSQPDRESHKLERMIKDELKYGTILELPPLDKNIRTGYTQTISKMIQTSVDEVSDAIPKVLAILVHRMIYVELREDLFELMYMPTCSDNPLCSVIAKFQVDGWASFLNVAPKDLRPAIARMLIDTLVNAWVYVVTDMAARGRPFTPADVNILLSDSESLHSLAEALDCKEDVTVQELLRLAGCLPLIVSGGSFDAAAEEALKEPNDISPWSKKPVKK